MHVESVAGTEQRRGGRGSWREGQDMSRLRGAVLGGETLKPNTYWAARGWRGPWATVDVREASQGNSYDVCACPGPVPERSSGGGVASAAARPPRGMAGWWQSGGRDRQHGVRYHWLAVARSHVLIRDYCGNVHVFLCMIRLGDRSADPTTAC